MRAAGFARPKEEVQAIACKGGQARHNSRFASMDPDKQVCISPKVAERGADTNESMQREIALKGGQASSRKFEPGSERAREAWRKGGLSSGGGNADEDE